MTDLDDIYSNKIMEFAAAISHTDPINDPDATASAHSKLCGSQIDVAIKIDAGRVTQFSQNVKACLLGQVTASIVGREIVGTTKQELRALAQTMHGLLKDDGPPPTGRWSDLAILEPVKDYHARHASTLLIFTALENAIRKTEKATNANVDRQDT